jgi:hypothetical protein
MTAYQQQLFSDLVNLNWEMDQDYPSAVKMAIVEQYWKVKNDLIEDMGKDEYEKYVSGMRQMFAPVGGYGDESPEEVERMHASI